MSNHLAGQSSPYLLQHAENPVDWYPWCEEAFERAKAEDKPVFLSIGYSTCHWCHVMAHESFEDSGIAALLNRYFIAIKVDKEERPDIDSIYMSVCQTFTGSGGWPTSIFMTPEQKPFFAGTYFPKISRYGSLGFRELLNAIHDKWENDRPALLNSAEQIVSHLKRQISQTSAAGKAEESLIASAITLYQQSYDERFGGFGDAPKFPAPHNLLFLMTHYEKSGDLSALKMAETTLLQLYRGGLFDHIGYGFCRYSTDQYFLVPHFEKMLYDNALLILAYCKAYSITKKELYLEIAEKTAAYILKEMTHPDGGFYSAQDADSAGVEGKYYVFSPSELTDLLGKETGEAFNQYFGITAEGNFQGKSIPNLLNNMALDDRFDFCLPTVAEYRRERNQLHLDDKILTGWNSLMIAAFSALYRVSKKEAYLEAAKKAQRFIKGNLCASDTLFVSFRKGTHGERGFLDEYSFYIFALLSLYEATLDQTYLQQAQQFCKKAVADFYDEAQSGFFLYTKAHAQLIFRPKETYDGAIPSGNSIMAYNLVRLHHLTKDAFFASMAKNQLNFLSGIAEQYPTGYAMFLTALSDFLDAPDHVTVVVNKQDDLQHLPCNIRLGTVVTVLDESTEEYPLKDNKTTFYVCRGHSCLPPVNELGR